MGSAGESRPLANGGIELHAFNKLFQMSEAREEEVGGDNTFVLL